MLPLLTNSKVKWYLLLPAEFRTAQATLPVCFLPLGTVEWHGEHNALGLDALKAHALCIAAAQQAGGGVVHPPLYGGMGGLDKPATVVVEPELAWENYLLRPWLEQLLYEFQRQGFRAIIMLTGHYGHNQQIVVRETAARMAERLQIPILGTPEYWLAHDAGYLGDHAGIGETSLLWYLQPDLVALDRIDSDPEYGKEGRIREGSSPELGKRYAELIVQRLAAVAQSMPTWDEATLEKFIRAERALVSAQVQGWRKQGPWTAWARLDEHRHYGEWLVARDFDRIIAMANQLG
jgi:creatinine amidohydrolase